MEVCRMTSFLFLNFNLCSICLIKYLAHHAVASSGCEIYEDLFIAPELLRSYFIFGMEIALKEEVCSG